MVVDDVIVDDILIINFFKMKKIFLTSAIIVSLAACSKIGQGQVDFVQGMPDVPLMEGFTIEHEKSSIFDTTSGKIVESVAVGVATPKEVEAFYTDTLPHLGWAEADTLAFLKEGEELKITTERNVKLTTIHFYLSPSENIAMPDISKKKKK